MSGITLGNLQIANNGHTVTLMAQNGGVSSSTAILLITLANLLTPEDRGSGDVKKLNAHVAQVEKRSKSFPKHILPDHL